MDSLIVHRDDSVLESMNDWCKEHHGKSGLTGSVKTSTLSMQQVEDQVLEFVKRYVPKSGLAPLGGNSVYMDRLFMKYVLTILIGTCISSERRCRDWIHICTIELLTFLLLKNWPEDGHHQ